ncbi:MAG: hypothetical protein ABSF92_12295 [Candidatus Acidiferrales bacterium]|jgi:hypothetical protein
MFRDVYRKFACAALLLALGLLGCGQYNQPPGGSAPLAPSAAVGFCDNPTPGCASASSFSLNSLRDLNVVVNWQNVPEGTHGQKVSFFLPDGNLYQAFEKSFAIPEGSPAATATVQALPVAGTWITQRSLSGTWQVTVALDGQVLESQAVQLTP